MIKITSVLPSSKVFIALLILLVLVGGGIYIRNKKSNDSTQTTKHPEYLNFSGGYVFTVPENYIVDEQSVTGMQLVYSGQLTAKNLDEVYDNNGISVQHITELSDHSSNAFKGYVNKTILTDIKKNLSDDVQLKFGKSGGIDNARITVKKDSKQIRFVYLRGGNHPVIVISKEETDKSKKIVQSLVDVEKSDLKDGVESIKQTIQANVTLIKQQNAQALHSKGTSDWQSKNTKEQVAEAFKMSESITKNYNVTISGGSYNAGEFTVALRFSPIGKNSEASLGTLTFIKADGQWKIMSMTLPTPATASNASKPKPSN